MFAVTVILFELFYFIHHQWNSASKTVSDGILSLYTNTKSAVSLE